MRLISIVSAVAVLLSACGSSGPSREQTIAAFRAGPSAAERQGYHKIGTMQISQKGEPYSGFHVTVSQQRSLPEAYFQVDLRPVSQRPEGISRDYRIPDQILEDIPNSLLAEASVQIASGRGTDRIHRLAKEVAKRTYCVGRTVGNYDLKGTRVTDPASIAKVIAATGGDVLGKNISHLNIKRERIPVVDRKVHHTGNAWAQVNLKC
ncbi:MULTISPECIES: hypothetical protein [unclassified Leisingera]|uniref:hypothetical protein n=1 Tax=unclassified Leisingera TaxID=2614906 RepID=UPI00126A3673|nr:MULTISPECIES: hypothetical protein [unclassified Leisingera]